MPSSRVFGLDFTRALAISLVLFTHASFFLAPLKPDFEPLFMVGYLGVDLFFALSGFLIGGILLDSAAPGAGWVGRFWVRRWLRTLPNYYLFLLINIAIYLWIEGRWPQSLPYVFFVQNLAWPHPLFFPEAWSLALEEIFYLLAPLAMLVFLPVLRQRWQTVLVLVAALLVALLLRTLYVLDANPPWHEGVRKISLIRLDAIGYGVLAVYLCKAYALTLGARRRFAVAGALGLLAAWALYLATAIDTSVVARTLLFSIVSASFAAMLPLASVWLEPAWPPRAIAAVRRLALWSYALYLTHLPVMRVIYKLDLAPANTLGCYAMGVIFAALSIASAALVYRGFERPILALRDRWVPAQPRHANPVAARA
ncbi:MAG TPA: acyltransferase [Casimicrobiaceae bacterium]|nr:acyltransferase [Casimicrobiaceae bacterium]